MHIAANVTALCRTMQRYANHHIISATAMVLYALKFQNKMQQMLTNRWMTFDII